MIYIHILQYDISIYIYISLSYFSVCINPAICRWFNTELDQHFVGPEGKGTGKYLVLPAFVGGHLRMC